MSNISSTVKMILEKNPDTRENDNLLIIEVWKQDNPLVAMMSFEEFAQAFIANEFTSTESCRRIRQLLNNEFPGLRGKNHTGRRNNQKRVLESLREPSNYKGGKP